MNEPSSEQSAGEPGQLVAGRYRIKAKLAEGGVGTVFQTIDESSGDAVALKRMLPSAARNPRIASLFQREYHTLAQLTHPRIIDVFDYGVDEAGPYYTMELLDGKDLGELAPLPYKLACHYLRDVASSLALLHSRRLLHRDLSPRNVRCTTDGRCKLLDFGTMARFGVAEEIVGTPPLVPPEALRGTAMDQRADLYSFGALAYRVLTRRYAYRARRLEDLPQLWHTPPARPSQFESDIPPELDELVMSLLNLDPAVRPNSATEIIDRLNVIGSLSPDEDAVETAQAYLSNSRLIGRARHMERIDRRLSRAASGEGSTVLVEGNPGVGKTRILDEAALHAQLAGALTLRVDARAHAGPNAIARALVRALLHAAPQTAREAARPYAAALGQFYEQFERDTLGTQALPQDPRQSRTQAQAAALSWLVDLSQERMLVLLIDDLHRADEASASLLAALAHHAPSYPIVLIATRRLAGQVAAPQALSSIVNHARRIRLHRMRRQDTIELVESLFGQVPHARKLAEWMHDVTTGTPTQTMSLSQHLVDQGLARYVDGMWVLPNEVSNIELPQNLAITLSARAAALGPESRALAEALSVREGDLPLNLCAALADTGEAEMFVTLDELMTRGVLISAGEDYRFSQEALRETLLSEMDTERRKALHLRLGNALLGLSEKRAEDLVEAGWNLLRGGDETRGADMLAQAAPMLVSRGDSTSAAIPALEATLEVFERQHRPPGAALRLRSILVGAMDRKTALRHGDETIAECARHAGIPMALRLKPLVGKRIGFWVAAVWATLRRAMTPGARRGPTVVKALSWLYRCAFALLPVRAAVLDVEGLTRVVRWLEGMEASSAFGSIAVHAFRASIDGVRQRPQSAIDHIRSAREIFDRHPVIRGMQPAGRRAVQGALLIMEGMVAAQHSMRSSHIHQVVGSLEALRTSEGSATEAFAPEGGITNAELDASRHQSLAMHHLMRGELEEARRHREQVQVHNIQTGMKWQYDLWRTLLESVASGRSSDLAGLRRAAEQLPEFVADTPALQPMLDSTQGQLALGLGKYAEAVRLFERSAAVLPAGEAPGWDGAMHGLADSHLRSGDATRALQILDSMLAHHERLDGHLTSMQVIVQCKRADTLATLDRHDEASRLIDMLLEDTKDADNPMIIGLLHETGARVAWAARDRGRFDAHCTNMQVWYRQTANPALLARAQRTLELSRSVPPMMSDLDEPTLQEPITRIDTQRASAGVDPLLSDCPDEQERGRRALNLVIQQAGGTSGHLYLWRDNDLSLLVSMEAGEPQDDLERVLRKQVQDALDEDPDSGVPTTGAPLVNVIADSPGGEERYSTVLLSVPGDHRRDVVGAIALRLGADTLQAIRQPYLEAIARHFTAPAQRP